jgi:hypothetical protein
MYKRNKSRPRMEPCGIPHVTRLSEVITSPSWHFCLSEIRQNCRSCSNYSNDIVLK